VQRVDLVVATDLDGAVRCVAERLVAVCASAVRTRGRCRVAFSGGGTPRDLYHLLASPLWRARTDWEHVDAYLSDERYVAPNDPRANYRMLREHLLDHVLIPVRNQHPVPTSGGDIDTDAARYEATIMAEFAEERTAASEPDRRTIPRFDLILLGLGPDGHTGSLFPGSPAITMQDRLVTAVEPPAAPTPRITFTPKLINAADAVVVLTAGALKAGALARMLAADGDPAETPARAIRPTHGSFTIVTDLEACERLDTLPLRDGIVTTRI
jgi:6-phosphogluconolactonase